MVYAIGSKTLEQLSDGGLRDRLESSLKLFIFTGNRRHKRRYFSFLETFASSEGQPWDHEQATEAYLASRSAKDLDTPDDYPFHVRETFWKVLKRYSQCGCTDPVQSQVSSNRHDSRLRLMEKFESNDEDVIFDTVFSRTSDIGQGNDVEWQHLQFHISRYPLRPCKFLFGLIADTGGSQRKQQRLGNVGFALPEAQSHQSMNLSLNIPCVATIKSATQFCQILQKRIGPVKICLKVRDSKLEQMRDLKAVDDDIAHEQSVSLADVLERRFLAAKEKLLLAYILARSFWQFYDSEWMSSQWTTEAVQFFWRCPDESHAKHDSSYCLLKRSPYFTLTLQKSHSLLAAEYLPTEEVIHRYPRVLSLGIMLLEIGQGKGHGKAAEYISTQGMTFEAKINNFVHDITKTLHKKAWPCFDLQEEVRQAYRFIVRNCSDSKLFEANLKESSSQNNSVLTVEERRAILYKAIVYPLKELLQKLGWLDKSGNIQSKDYDEDDKLDIDNKSAISKDSPRPAVCLNAEKDSCLSQSRFVFPATSSSKSSD